MPHSVLEAALRVTAIRLDNFPKAVRDSILDLTSVDRAMVIQLDNKVELVVLFDLFGLKEVKFLISQLALGVVEPALINLVYLVIIRLHTLLLFHFLPKTRIVPCGCFLLHLKDVFLPNLHNMLSDD